MVYAECYLDTLFVRLTLQLPAEHVFGFGETIKRLLEDENNTVSCFVDKVKRKGQKYDRFHIVNQNDMYDQLEFQNKRIVYVSIGLERFIIQICNKYNIQLADFNLPNTFDALRQITKKQIIEKNQDLLSFLSSLATNEEIVEIADLKRWLQNQG